MMKQPNWILPLVVVICAVTGCAGDPGAPKLRPGELPAGTVKASVDGRPAVSSERVRCSPAGAQMAISTGGDESGTAATVDGTDGLVALSVELRGIDGFTGSYWRGVGEGQPEVSLKGRTYLIEGTAMGFSDDNPSARIAQDFSIQVAC